MFSVEADLQAQADAERQHCEWYAPLVCRGTTCVRTTESFCDRATGVKIKGNGGEFIYALRFDKAFMSAVEKLLRNKERVEEMQLASRLFCSGRVSFGKETLLRRRLGVIKMQGQSNLQLVR